MKKQTALVTGGANGLGYHISRQLYLHGYNVIVTSRKLVDAERVAHEIDPTGDSVHPFPLDISRKEDFLQAMEFVNDTFGELQVAVNNAGMTTATPLMEITSEEFETITLVNQRGTFFGCQVFGSEMSKANYGRIINLGSLAGQNGGSGTGAHYAATKGAIITLTKLFAKELAPHGVTVNAVAPGPLESPALHATLSKEKIEALIERIPVQRFGDMDFVADTIVHLARPDAYFTTGAVWDINGGIYMR